MTTTSDAPRRHPGRLLAALGLGLAALGIAAYVVQIAAQRLTTPWYLPIAATLGGSCLVVSLWQERTVWRVLALLLVLLLAGAEWTFLLRRRGCRLTRGRSRKGGRSRRSRRRGPTARRSPSADLEGGQEQRAGLLPRPVVTVLHDRAGSARTTPRRLRPPQHPRDRGLGGRAGRRHGRRRPTSRTCSCWRTRGAACPRRRTFIHPHAGAGRQRHRRADHDPRGPARRRCAGCTVRAR